MGNELKNARHEKFCNEYIVDFNATQAYIRAGYSKSGAVGNAKRMTQNDQIKKRIYQLSMNACEDASVNKLYVINKLKEIAELDILDILESDLSKFKPLNLWPRAWRTSLSAVDIKRIVSSDDDSIEMIIEKVKWPDKLKSIELLGKHVNVGAFNEPKDSGKNNNDDSETVRRFMEIFGE